MLESSFSTDAYPCLRTQKNRIPCRSRIGHGPSIYRQVAHWNSGGVANTTGPEGTHGEETNTILQTRNNPYSFVL